MIKNLKPARVLFCALALGASTCGMAQAQDAAPAANVPAEAPAANAAPTPAPALRILSIVTEQGSFKNVFNSFNEALTAAQGNSYNKTLRNGHEIIVMNAPPTEGDFVDKVTFSLYKVSGYDKKNDLEPLVKSYLDYRAAHPETSDNAETRQRERALIDGVMKILAASPSLLAPNTVPVALALAIPKVSKPETDEAPKPSPETKTNGGLVKLPEIIPLALRLEADDAQNPLIGPKINDGVLYETVYGRLKPLAKREDLEKYGYNRFATAQDALNTATIIPGTKAIIFNGTNFSLYRIDAFKFPDTRDDSRFDVLKTTPVPKGWIIVAVVPGRKFIKIYDPEAKQ